MEILSTIIGMVVLVCFAVAALIVAATWLLWRLDVMFDARYADGLRAGRDAVAASLLRDADWFSEDIPTKRLLEALGKHYSVYDCSHVTTVREDWRGWRAAQGAK